MPASWIICSSHSTLIPAFPELT